MSSDNEAPDVKCDQGSRLEQMDRSLERLATVGEVHAKILEGHAKVLWAMTAALIVLAGADKVLGLA